MRRRRGWRRAASAARKWGPRRPLGPLFGPTCRAGGLFQRSLLGLLSPRALPSPVLSRRMRERPTTGAARTPLVRPTEGVRVKRDRSRARRRDLHRRASILVRAPVNFFLRGQTPVTLARRRAGPPRRARRRAARARRWCGRRSVIAAAIARWPACSAMSRCISWRDLAVRGMARRRGAQLEQVHRLARVHLHHEADAGTRATPRTTPARGTGRRARRRATPSAPSRRRTVARGRLRRSPRGRRSRARVRQRLPLDREHAVTLQVAERAVVGEDVEAVVDALERAARAVTTVVAAPPRTRAAASTRSSSPSVRTRARIWSSGRCVCG